MLCSRRGRLAHKSLIHTDSAVGSVLPVIRAMIYGVFFIMNKATASPLD